MVLSLSYIDLRLSLVLLLNTPVLIYAVIGLSLFTTTSNRALIFSWVCKLFPRPYSVTLPSTVASLSLSKTLNADFCSKVC